MITPIIFYSVMINDVVSEVMFFQDHSKWLVKCVDSQDALSSLDLIALSRLSSQVKKHVLLAVVSPDTLSPYYIEYSWWKSQRPLNV